MRPLNARIDGPAPWLVPLHAAAVPVQARLAAGATVAQALNLPGAPRRFVEASELPPAAAYESWIAGCGCVPTRDNLHDLCNGLAWHAWPALKTRLNALHADALARTRVGPVREPVRGPLRDALTHFDEHGALLQGPQALCDALRERRWADLFVHRRALWARARLEIVGHALVEQLLTAPRKGLTAHVIFGSADDAAALTAAQWAAKPFLPLPVLGVPGWWPANEDPAYYEDAQVFRPARRGAMGPGGLKADGAP